MSDAAGGLNLRSALAAISMAAALLPAACSVSLGSQTATQPTPGRATIPVTPGPAGAPAGLFDPVRVAGLLGPAVGTVIVSTRTGGGEGSGFVIAGEGAVSYLLTNNHVVEGAQRVTVLMPNGRHYAAVVQGTDPIQDLAVLRLPDPNLPRAEFADSTHLQVGQPVVAIGSPQGQVGSVTVGVISALHRTIRAGGSGPAETLPDVIQTDAPINPGNSGGPLADADGKVVGVNTATSASANSIGFAIPSLVAKRIAEALIAGRRPGHPYLGICYLTDHDALARGETFDGFGVLVQKVQSGTPADRAGLRPGDVIERVDATAPNNGQTLGGVLQLHDPGEQVRLGVLRAGSGSELLVVLGDRPANPPAC